MGELVGSATILMIAGKLIQKIMINMPKTVSPMISRQFILRLPGGGGSSISGFTGPF